MNTLNIGPNLIPYPRESCIISTTVAQGPASNSMITTYNLTAYSSLMKVVSYYFSSN